MISWTAACQVSKSIINSLSLLKLMSIELVMPSNHLILCYPVLLSSIFPSISVFSNESVLCIRWPKYWSFTFSNSLSNEYSGLISFRMGWLDLLHPYIALREEISPFYLCFLHLRSDPVHCALLSFQFNFCTLDTPKFSVIISLNNFLPLSLSIFPWDSYNVYIGPFHDIS